MASPMFFPVMAALIPPKMLEFNPAVAALPTDIAKASGRSNVFCMPAVKSCPVVFVNSEILLAKSDFPNLSTAYDTAADLAISSILPPFIAVIAADVTYGGMPK